MSGSPTTDRPRSLRAVFFDVDDTLYSTTEFAQLAQQRAIQAMIDNGLQVPFEVAAAELAEVIAEFSSNDSRQYQKLLQRVPPTACEGVNPALIVAAGVVAYHQTKVQELRPFPDVHPVLARLAETDLVLGVITSGLTVKQAEKLVRLDVVKYLRTDAIFITEQVGMAKSNPRLFERACRDVGVEPGQAMYVGDRPVDDIVGPSRAGLVTVLRAGTGKHARQPATTQPDHRIEDLRGLEDVLQRDYGVSLPAPVSA